VRLCTREKEERERGKRRRKKKHETNPHDNQGTKHEFNK
jgi:hypothetical protein